jgi:magnesium chelatase subunit D
MPDQPADTARGYADALHAAALLLVDPAALGGAAVRAQAGPVRDAWLAALRQLLPAGMPLLRLPAHAGEDRLLGGIDLPATLAAGRPVAQQGLMAAADGGLLLAAMAERAPAAMSAHLAAALDNGAVVIEREGISARTPTRLAVVAFDEALPDDEPVSPALADRLAFWLDLRALSVRDLSEVPRGLAQDILAARQLVPRVQVPVALMEALCAATLALGVDSGRAAWLAVSVARASAALCGRDEADADDAACAARLVLSPRATRLPQPPPPEEEPSPPPEVEPSTTPETSAEEPQQGGELEERVVEAALAAIPLGLLARLASGELARDRQRSAGRSGALSASRQRGRPLGARRGEPHAGARLHLMATLRAAAPWQRLRRQQAGPGGPAVLVRADDFHIKRFAQRRNTTTVFAIDASGSSALYRLNEAKGAVELLLAECYVRRDQVAVISFRGQGAELLLPPTRSLVRAKRGLAGLPGGGGTPLAAGILAAAVLVDQVRRAGTTPVLVLLTDGRANVGLDGEGGRVRAQEDAMAAARRLRALGCQTVLIDTSPRPEPAAAALALALGARYLPLPQADARALSGAVHVRATAPAA